VTLSRDGWLLFAAAGVRTLAYGGVSVILGPYLASRGLGPAAIGWVFTGALAGGAALTVVLTVVADRLGRRRMQVVGAALMTLAGLVFALTDHLGLLVAAAVLGTVSPSGKDVGPFLALEQAMIPSTTSDDRRTAVFAAYNLVTSLAAALGALGAGLPALLGTGEARGYRLLLLGYAGIGVVLAALFASLSPRVEVAPTPARGGAGRPGLLGIRRSRGIVARLAALFALDAFAGGFVVQSLMAYWFHLRFGVDAAGLAGIFFGTNLLAAVSFLAAVPVARRIGLLNTMVFTHLPSNVLLLLVPLVPTLSLAVTVLLVRHLLSQMDVPTRQSYTMAVVDPAERSAAAGLTAVARNVAAALAPAVAAPTLALPALGLPFLVAGILKIVYDLALWAQFRTVRPPEEGALGRSP
jgi:MFS family permease